MAADIKSNAEAVSVYAAQIEHLAIAGDCILQGSSPADKELCAAIASTIFDMVKELATASQDASVSIEQALLEQKKAA